MAEGVQIVPVGENGFDRLELMPGDSHLQECESENGRGSLFIVLPGQDCVDCIPVTRDPAAASRVPRLWHLTGEGTKITLSPSINAQGRWHGWLRNGILESC